MTISTCPRCGENVCVPEGASSNAQVRCPLCQDEFELAEALGGLPPSLVVLNDPSVGSAVYGFAGGGGTAVATAPSTDAPAFQFEEGPAPSASGAPAPAARRPARRQGSQKSVIVEMIKVVGGGVIGLAIALVLLWWLPFGWHRDPFKLGPKVPSFLSFIVPKEFRDTNPPLPQEDEAENTNAGASTNQSSQTANANSKDGNSFDFNNNAQPFSLDSAVKQKNQVANADNDTSVSSATTGNETNNGESVTESNTEQPPAAEPLRLRDTGMIGASDLSRATDKYKEAATTWAAARNATGAEKEKVDREFYAALAGLGQAVSLGDPSDQEIKAGTVTINKLLTSLASSDSRFAYVGQQAAHWLDDPSRRSNPGALLAGTVVDVHPNGTVYESEIELASTPLHRVSIVLLSEPDASFRKGAKVVVPAVVVDDPSEGLVGYQGDAREVVCARYAISMPFDAASTEPKTTEATEPAKTAITPVDLPDIPVPSVNLPPISVPSLDLSPMPSTPPEPTTPNP